MRRLVAALTILCATGMACSACVHETTSPFPLELGFQPLEPLDAGALPPDPVDGDPFPQQLGTPVFGTRDGHDWAHARGYLKYPLAKVYQALHDPRASLLHHIDGWSWTPGTEPFPVSFTIHYSAASGVVGVGDVHWDVAYRAGPLQGTEADLQVVGERYQKVSGISALEVMAGSLKAYPVSDGSVTGVELISWLEAPSGTAYGTVQDLYADLVGVLQGL